MNTLMLDALPGSNPLAALAAFGLLKSLHEAGFPVRLSWVERDDWTACLHGGPGDAGALLRWLEDWVRTDPADELTWTDGDVRMPPEQYRALLAEAVDAAPALAEFLGAVAADGAVDNAKGKGYIKPTQFYMASGQQQFLDTFRELHGLLKEQPETQFEEALFGPWRYSTRLWGAGWDPSTERSHAQRHMAPAAEKTRCIAAAVWLGLKALPLFPSYSVNARERTVGFVQSARERYWRWPIHSAPLSLPALRLLLGSAEVAHAGAPLRPRPGLAAIYESRRHEFGQGYGVFRPATRLA